MAKIHKVLNLPKQIANNLNRADSAPTLIDKHSSK